MKRPGLTLTPALTLTLALSAGLGAVSPAAARPASPLCAALDALAGQVRASGQAEYVTVTKLEPMEVGCAGAKAGDTVEARFCAAAIEEAGVQFSHRYAWALRGCLGFGPSVSIEENAWAHTGIGERRIDHMAARLGGGVRLDLRYLPDPKGDDPADPHAPQNGYFGRYVLTLFPS